MTKKEKKELGLLLDKHRVKSIVYLGSQMDYYTIFHQDDKNNYRVTKIFGKDLE